MRLLVLALHSVETAPKGFLTHIRKRIDPFSPPLLLNLFSSAPPSSKGKKKIKIWCEVIAVLCCVECISCACELWSLVYARWRHSLGELTTILTHGIFFCVSVVCRSSTTRFQPCIVVVIGSVDRSLLHALSSTRLCTRSHSLIIGDAVLAVLHQYFRGAGSGVIMCVNVRLRFLLLCLCDFGVKTKLPVLFVLGESSRICCFVFLWVKIQ